MTQLEGVGGSPVL